jgi:hypothetical protein
MEVNTDAPSGAAAPVVTSTPPPTDDGGPLTLRQATQARVARAQSEAPPQADVDQRPPVARAPDGKFASTQELPEVYDAPALQPGVEEAAPAPDPVEELPPVAPPRSWSKEDKELFNSLPRETQERVAERERSRESDFLRRQNEAAEHSKAVQAERQAAEQARQQYEQAIQATAGTLMESMNKDFADIRSWADVEKMAAEDPFRYSQFDARMKGLQAMQAEQQRAQYQRQQEAQQHFEQWSAEQDRLFTEAVPEFADEAKAGAARKEVVSYLTETIGVDAKDLPALWKGASPIFLRDAKVQRIVRDAAKWNAASKKAATAAKAQVPPVQRPGTAPAKGANNATTLASLQQQLSRETSPMKQARIATEIRALKRA